MPVNDEIPEEEEQPQITAEEYLALQKKSIRNKSWWGIGIGGVLVTFHLLGFLLVSSIGEVLLTEDGEPLHWTILFKSMFFVLGLFGLAAGLFGLRYAKKLTLEDIIPTSEAVEFLRQGQGTVPYYSYFLVGCIVLVTFVQYATDTPQVTDTGELKIPESILNAGLVKLAVFREGEYWRILTAAALHGGLLHIYFNGQALYGFGGLIELISNRAHASVVFLLAVISGNLFSLFSMSGNRPSVGASGGILGMVGYLAVYGYRRRQQLPPDFLRSILINVAFIAGIGIVGYQFIDNFAHLGGLLAGAAYGFVQIPRDLKANPREAGPIATVAGMVSLVAFGAAALLAILRLTE